MTSSNLVKMTLLMSSRLLDELMQQRRSGSENSRRMLDDLISQLLDGSGQSSISRPMSTTNRDTLVDLLLRVTSSCSNDANAIASQPLHLNTILPAQLPGGFDMLGSQAVWMGRGGVRSMWGPAMGGGTVYGVPLPRAVYPMASEGVRVVPRYMTGIWR